MENKTRVGVPGQSRALWMSTIAFTVCFAVWTLFAIIGIQIKQQLGLNETQFGLLIGTPILTGSIVRIFLGIWTDQYGGRRVHTVVMLAAAVATFLLVYAHTYLQFLIAALGVGVAGGSFAVGIAYVSRWYSAEKQSTAFGIFGAGNVGAAVTVFCAPFVLVAYGWQTTAQVWASAIAIMAVLFWFTTSEDPVERARRANGERPHSAWLELEALKNVQVWRFSLYYFFAFGAFVALSLWLPRYLIGVYKLDIETAGMLGAAYSHPGKLVPRLWRRAVRPLWCAPHHVLDVRRIGADHIHPGLSADRIRRAEHARPDPLPHGDRRRHLHLPDFRAWLLHEPGEGCGVQAHPGLLPGQCRFGRRSGRHDRRPRRFRAADRLRCAQRPDRHLDQLLHAAVPLAGGSLLWMHLAIQRMEREALATGLHKLPEFPEMEPIHEEKHVGVLSGHVLAEWKPEDPAFWESKGRAIARRNLWISIPALLLAFVIWRCGRSWSPSCLRSASSSPTISCSGWRLCPACPARHCASSIRSCRRSSAAVCGRRCRPGR